MAAQNKLPPLPPMQSNPSAPPPSATTGAASPATSTTAAHGGASSSSAPSDETRVLSVASTSRVKAVAGSISHTVRDQGKAPTLQAVGASSVNQAVKSIAVARTFLESELYDLRVEPSRVPDEAIRNLVQLKLHKTPRVPVEGTFADLRAAAQTDTSALAGAIANVVRDGAIARVTAVGASSVFRAVDSIIKARSFVQKRDSYDLLFVPSFVQLASNNNNGNQAGGGGGNNNNNGEESDVINAVQFLVMRSGGGGPERPAPASALAATPPAASVTTTPPAAPAAGPS